MSPKDTPIRITEQAYRQIIEFLGTHAPEHGGIIGADSNGTVMSFFPDVSGKSTKNGYTPDIRMLNAHIQTHWYPQQIHLVGIVHSHYSSSTPSCGDLFYAAQLLQHNNMAYFHLPIVSLAEGILFNYYVTYRNGQQSLCMQVPYEIINKGDSK